MTICERLFSMLGEKRGQQEAFAAYIGVAPTTITNWKQRNTDPPAKLIVPICEFLSCSTIFLLTGKEDESIAEDSTEGISKVGLQIARLWDQLDDRGQTIVMAKIYERQEAMTAGAEALAPAPGQLRKEA